MASEIRKSFKRLLPHLLEARADDLNEADTLLRWRSGSWIRHRDGSIRLSSDRRISTPTRAVLDCLPEGHDFGSEK